MGGFFDSLTRSGVDTGNDVSFLPSKAAAGKSLAHAYAGLAEPSRADVQGVLGEPEISPAPMANAGDIVPGANDTTLRLGGPPQISGFLPRMVKPSFVQASETPSGLPASVTPGLTRLGKLVQVLGLAARGAMAGRAASERAVAESGGRRSGGFGLGFEAAQEEPYREAAMKRANEMGAIQTEMARQNLQPVQTPWGAMPWFRAQQRAQLERWQGQTKAANAMAAYRNWQMENPKPTQQEEIQAKIKIAQDAGWVTDSDEFKQFVYGIKPAAEARPETPHTVEVGNRVKQYNSKTGFYDIDVGPAPTHREGNKPTSDEFRVALFKSDPETYQAIYGGSKDETQIRKSLLQYANTLSDRLRNGEYADENERTDLLGMQRAIDQEVKQMYGQKPPAKPSTTPKKGDRKSYQGHPYEFDGSKWVLVTQ